MSLKYAEQFPEIVATAAVLIKLRSQGLCTAGLYNRLRLQIHHLCKHMPLDTNETGSRGLLLKPCKSITINGQTIKPKVQPQGGQIIFQTTRVARHAKIKN